MKKRMRLGEKYTRSVQLIENDSLTHLRIKRNFFLYDTLLQLKVGNPALVLVGWYFRRDSMYRKVRQLYILGLTFTHA